MATKTTPINKLSLEGHNKDNIFIKLENDTDTESDREVPNQHAPGTSDCNIKTELDFDEGIFKTTEVLNRKREENWDINIGANCIESWQVNTNHDYEDQNVLDEPLIQEIKNEPNWDNNMDSAPVDPLKIDTIHDSKAIVKFEKVAVHEEMEAGNQKPNVSKQIKKKVHKGNSLNREKNLVNLAFCQYELIYTDKTTYPCDLCDKTFNKASGLKRHLNKHKFGHSERPHSCDVCDKSFKFKSILLEHKLTHTGEKPHVCSDCGKSFTQRSGWRKHKRLHGKRIHKCDICDRSFKKDVQLERHKRIHTGEKPYTCEVCNKSFDAKCYLNLHNLTHTGEKPHTCSDCGISFTKKSSLNKHKMRHTGEKPYICNICDLTFPRYMELARHKLDHVDIIR